LLTLNSNVVEKLLSSEQFYCKAAGPKHKSCDISRKKSAYHKYLESREGKDYLEYVKSRNEAKSEIRRAVRGFEREISKKAKKDPKAFYKYANSKLKTRSGILDLYREDGY